ncbi:hypothetical protein [Embleya sp. NPDC005971]|uniref:hypothetical protein n=1 Tax=Embleya sp. NPDC005971 TaxID=3156724 RepID=UPI0033CBCA8A
MRIACRTHRGRGRAGCVIPASIGPALISARSMDSDVSPELSGVSPFADSGEYGERAAHPDHTELDEETLTALRLFAAEGMLAAVGAQLREPIGGAVRPG